MPSAQLVRYGTTQDWTEIQMSTVRFTDEPKLKGFDSLAQHVSTRITVEGYLLEVSNLQFTGGLRAIRRALLKPGRTIEIWEGESLLFGCGAHCTSMYRVTSVDLGPWPKAFEVLDIVGGLGTRIRWAVEVNYVRDFSGDLVGYPPEGVTHNSYSIAYDIDQNLQGRRTVAGSLTVRVPNNPDNYRNFVTQKLFLPENWIRVSSKWAVAREAPNVLAYNLVDAEVLRRFPQPMTSGDVTLEVNIEGAKIDMFLNGTIRCPNNVARSTLLDLFEKLANNYLGLSHQLVLPTDIRVGGSIFKNELTFSLGGRFALANAKVTRQVIALALSQLVADKAPFDTNYQWLDDEYGSGKRMSLIDYIEGGVARVTDAQRAKHQGPKAKRGGQVNRTGLSRVVEFQDTVTVSHDPGETTFQPMDPAAKPIVQKLRPQTVTIREYGAARIEGGNIPEFASGIDVLPQDLQQYVEPTANIVVMGPTDILDGKEFTSFAWQKTHEIKITSGYGKGQITVIAPKNPYNPERARMKVSTKVTSGKGDVPIIE